MFYILTEFDAQGFHMVGYFSKVKQIDFSPVNQSLSFSLSVFSLG